MDLNSGVYAGLLRRELAARSRAHARGRAHVESYGGQPVIVYAPEAGRHGNFLDRAYEAIASRPEWMRRFNKIHAQGRRALPKPTLDPNRKWRELDSSMSSDALLMNVFCTPGVVESTAMRSVLGLEAGVRAEFGWKARVPLNSGLVDRTEVDMRLGSLLVEAKLTESGFQTRKAAVVEAYRDFDVAFERELLPRVAIPLGRQKEAVEFPELYSQEYEETDPGVSSSISRMMPRAAEPGYASYQLIRNVLAACAHGYSFCVVHDARRPDLREAWYQVMAAVKSAELRVRLMVLTWQELVPLLPRDLQSFLDEKYGIAAPGQKASPWQGDDSC
jgi:hypothetical protein